MRAARLNADGTPRSGAQQGYVSTGLIQVQIQPDFQDGQEITQDNGCGGICAFYKGPDILKKYNVSFDLCQLDFDLLAIVTTQSTITSGGVVIGNYLARSGACTTVTNNGVSLEFWSKRWAACGVPTDGLLYWHWVFPYVILRTGDMTLQNGFLTVPVTGYAQEDAAWGDGPFGDLPVASIPSVGAVFATATIPDTPGYVTVP
jgi:hypothetical protein